MSKSTGVIQLGASGIVAERFEAITAQPDFPFHLEAIVPAHNTELVGKMLGQAHPNCPPGLEEVPFISVEDALHNTNAPAVFSALRGEAALEYDDQFGRERVVFSNSPAYRMAADVALTNGYVGSKQIDELFSVPRPRHIVNNGNCGGGISAVAFKPLHKKIGIVRIAMSTLQGWSGKGLHEVPEGKGKGPSSMEGDEWKDEKHKLETEPLKLLGSMAVPADIEISASPQRAPWVYGHIIVAQVTFARPTTTSEIKDRLRSFRAPKELKGLKYGDDSPRRKPVKVVDESPLEIDESGSMQGIDPLYPMRVTVQVTDVSGIEAKEVEIKIGGHNTVLGAAGASAQNMVIAKRRGYIG